MANAVANQLSKSSEHISLMAIFGFAVIGAIIALSILAPMLAPESPSAIVGRSFEAPGKYFLGTDVLGRDVLSRVIYGARLTLLITVSATSLGFLVGVAWGFATAEVGGLFDTISNGLANILLAFPPLMLGLLIIAALSTSHIVLIIAIALIQMPRIFRVARAAALNVTNREFVEVARARGERLSSILRREVLPNVLRPLGVEYGLRLTYATLLISSLSFLGLGIQPPDADWGSLVRENISGVQLGAYLPALVPALAVATFALGLNLLVDWFGGKSAPPISKELT